jgi:hypothetical protein
LDVVLHSLALTLVYDVSACSQRDASKPPVGSTAANSADCRSGTPQETADTWLRQRLRTGAASVSTDTLHLHESDSSEHRDSTKMLGNGYAAYFRLEDGVRFRSQVTFRRDLTIVAADKHFSDAASPQWL